MNSNFRFWFDFYGFFNFLYLLEFNESFDLSNGADFREILSE